MERRGERGSERERGGREREGREKTERERERERGLGKGALTLMFELIAGYLKNASWWMVGSSMARIGEEGRLMGAGE